MSSVYTKEFVDDMVGSYVEEKIWYYFNEQVYNMHKHNIQCAWVYVNAFVHGMLVKKRCLRFVQKGRKLRSSVNRNICRMSFKGNCTNSNNFFAIGKFECRNGKELYTSYIRVFFRSGWNFQTTKKTCLPMDCVRNKAYWDEEKWNEYA